eukprot:607377_1
MAALFPETFPTKNSAANEEAVSISPSAAELSMSSSAGDLLGMDDAGEEVVGMDDDSSGLSSSSPPRIITPFEGGQSPTPRQPTRKRKAADSTPPSSEGTGRMSAPEGTGQALLAELSPARLDRFVRTHLLEASQQASRAAARSFLFYLLRTTVSSGQPKSGRAAAKAKQAATTEAVSVVECKDEKDEKEFKGEPDANPDAMVDVSPSKISEKSDKKEEIRKHSVPRRVTRSSARRGSVQAKKKVKRGTPDSSKSTKPTTTTSAVKSPAPQPLPAAPSAPLRLFELLSGFVKSPAPQPLPAAPSAPLRLFELLSGFV